MKLKTIYSSPAVVKVVSLAMEGDVLAESVVDTVSDVKTTGQEVETHDFTGSSFNHDWE